MNVLRGQETPGAQALHPAHRTTWKTGRRSCEGAEDGYGLSSEWALLVFFLCPFFGFRTWLYRKRKWGVSDTTSHLLSLRSI